MRNRLSELIPELDQQSKKQEIAPPVEKRAVPNSNPYVLPLGYTSASIDRGFLKVFYSIVDNDEGAYFANVMVPGIDVSITLGESIFIGVLAEKTIDVHPSFLRIGLTVMLRCRGVSD